MSKTDLLYNFFNFLEEKENRLFPLEFALVHKSATYLDQYRENDGIIHLGMDGVDYSDGINLVVPEGEYLPDNISASDIPVKITVNSEKSLPNGFEGDDALTLVIIPPINDLGDLYNYIPDDLRFFEMSVRITGELLNTKGQGKIEHYIGEIIKEKGGQIEWGVSVRERKGT